MVRRKNAGASGGANRDAGLSTHLVVVVVVVFSRALRLEMMNAGVVNRRSRGASRDGEDRRGIGRAMRRRKISCARNEKWIAPSAGDAPSCARSWEFSRDVRDRLPLPGDAAAFEAVDGTRGEGKGSDPRISLVVGLEASGRGRVTIRKRAMS